MTKKILYLTYFFEPDLGAGSFRNSALAESLSARSDGQAEITLITTQPNRYESLREAAPVYEKRNNMEIHRIPVRGSSGSILDQVYSFAQFFYAARKISEKSTYDLVFASSSKFFTAWLGFILAKKQNAKLYIDLRDLFTENLKEFIRIRWVADLTARIIQSLFEKPCLRYASHINVNSEGFLSSLGKENISKTSFYPNGIDDFFIGCKQSDQLPESPKIICYAGNIGEGQGLEKIIPPLAKMLGSDWRIRIIGDGSNKSKLEELLTKEGIENTEIIPPVRRKELLKYYSEAHYLLVHLNDYESFKKVIPSKLFEYGCTDLPILAGVSGYAREFIQKYIPEGVYLFDPCDAQAAYRILQSFPPEKFQRPDFINRFSRKKISDEMSDSIMCLLQTKPS